jgi:3',5'-cyclic-AMP phosphodiesterase
MRTTTFAHVSDLHVGQSPSQDRRTGDLCRALVDARVDHVVVTGDLTHNGRPQELARFEKLFAPLLCDGRVTVIPGNHDRLGTQAAWKKISGPRVRTASPGNGALGLHLVLVDSTGPHNRFFHASHGLLQREDLEAIDAAVAQAPEGALCVVLVHHHVQPLPEDNFVERTLTRLGWSSAAELALGRRLLERLIGRCDLLLHGHRHVPHLAWHPKDLRRPLWVYGAGISSRLGQVRLFTHRMGKALEAPRWLVANPQAPVEVPFRARLRQLLPSFARQEPTAVTS